PPAAHPDRRRPGEGREGRRRGRRGRRIGALVRERRRDRGLPERREPGQLAQGNAPRGDAPSPRPDPPGSPGSHQGRLGRRHRGLRRGAPAHPRNGGRALGRHRAPVPPEVPVMSAAAHVYPRLHTGPEPRAGGFPVDRAAAAFRGLLESLGLDLTDPNLAGTADRVARAYREMLGGLRDAEPTLSTFPNAKKYRGIVSVT